MSSITSSSSIKSLLVFVILVISIASVPSKVEGKIIDVILNIFDAPNQIDLYATSPGHYADKTIEFLAFGDAAMDYYVN
ncbi:hypothetical protein FRACYDRAFT_268850 [Fragilariopsis cylindrus CCMP1102]|uniref:Uncharacterized protein n=1 Tax=Fragilariopsis cylindrus CCMP1102 TaxID=635003 RepID=A0A1E7FIS4_9STRA|nr:hypothetical protein FRACYDRAFT_268850 [Fragilariopsis cylindrus CCMP1102]|eukprot:OEU18037.1 hypothetical protein FRACYDRAFT_268850 [Fragilariopsis cylindrus CCMP1102]